MVGPSYEFVDGTFHFFKVFARRPGATLSLIFWQILAYTAILGLALLALSPAFPIIADAIQYQREPDESEIIVLIGSIWLGLLALQLLAIVFSLMIQAAWLRLLTHGRTAPVIPFRFGSDELRLLGVNICFFLLGIAMMTAYFILFGILGFIGAVTSGGDGPGAALILAPILMIFVVFPLVLFVALRFAAAPAMTINEGGFRFFSSWRATGRIWAWMLLSYLVLLVVVWAAMTAIGIYAVSEGDYRLVVYPMDYDGNVCGTDFGGVDMTDYPFLHCTLVRNAASMVSAQIICHEPHIPHPFFQIKTSTHSLVACACRIAPWSVKYYGARPTRRPPNYLDLPWT